jgi:hypothetical protein
VTGHGLEIDTALSGDGPIASGQVLSWIDAAADSDLLTLSELPPKKSRFFEEYGR